MIKTSLEIKTLEICLCIHPKWVIGKNWSRNEWVKNFRIKVRVDLEYRRSESTKWQKQSNRATIYYITLWCGSWSFLIGDLVSHPWPNDFGHQETLFPFMAQRATMILAIEKVSLRHGVGRQLACQMNNQSKTRNRVLLTSPQEKITNNRQCQANSIKDTWMSSFTRQRLPHYYLIYGYGTKTTKYHNWI